MDPADDPDNSNLESEEFRLEEIASSDGKAMQKLGNAMEVLTRVDLDLAYSYEKLGNMHILFTHALAWENDFEAMDMTSEETTSEEFLEKALVFDLLSGVLDSEVKELDSFTYCLQDEIDDARTDIYSCTHLSEVFSIMEAKLHDVEKSWKQSQEQILDMKMLSAKLERTIFAGGKKKLQNEMGMDLFIDNDQSSTTNAKSKLHNIEQQRYILRMTERSMARELDLEKKFLESRENEENLKLKLHHTERVAFHMEEAAEVAWGRLLEAENTAEVLMGTSKDLLSRLHIFQFNLNGTMQRETAVKSELQECLEQLKSTESEKHIAENSELLSLRNKVKSLEEQLKESEERVMNESSLNETSQEKLSSMEGIIESLNETINEGESRVENAEAKVTELTETNIELTEELNFLKGSENKEEKIGLLEKQVRDLEHQLLHAKASSEASQEQHNMLYSAIWDMETLIEDLKSKVSKSETKFENAEEKCLVLSKVNVELNKELNFMRVRMEDLEASSRHVNDEKQAMAEDISIKSKIIMDTVMKLATERERIEEEFYSLTLENIMLKWKCQANKPEGPVFTCEKSGAVDSEICCQHESPHRTILKAESTFPRLQEEGRIFKCVSVTSATNIAIPQVSEA